MNLSRAQQQRVKELALGNKGNLTPEMIVKEAKKKRSPLHNLFEWDVDKAAMRTWTDTARTIICSVHVSITEHSVVLPTNAYVEDPDKPPNTQGYVSTVTLRSNKDKARRALVVELNRAESYMARAHRIAAALGLSEETEAILAQIRHIARTG